MNRVGLENVKIDVSNIRLSKHHRQRILTSVLLTCDVHLNVGLSDSTARSLSIIFKVEVDIDLRPDRYGRFIANL